ncbi:MAG: response regulator transcription factor [Gemmatimonadota bacterium]|nr:response regulator transcription factor [Gemmatimonadota bacterium]
MTRATSQKIRVFIADDHPIVREGLRRILNDRSDIRVVGEAANAEEIFDRLDVGDTHVLLLDISMPGPGFLETMRQLRESDVKILVVSMYPEDQFGLRALKAGAAGYLTKDQSPDELVEAIRRVHSGRRYLSELLADRLASEFADGDGEPHEELSEREFQVMQMLGEGMTIGEISDRLSLSPKTVSTYRTRILRKLDLRTTADIVRYAVENELVS